MRLIDAEELMEWADTWGKKIPADALWGKVRRMIVHDAVHVIRCKECKHRDPEDKKCDCGHDIIWQLPRDDDWYCADSERKEE